MVTVTLGAPEIYRIDEKILVSTLCSGGFGIATVSIACASPQQFIVSLWRITNGLSLLSSITLPVPLSTVNHTNATDYCFPNQVYAQKYALLWNPVANRLLLQLPSKLIILQIEWEADNYHANLRDVLTHDDMIEDSDGVPQPSASMSVVTELLLAVVHVTPLDHEQRLLVELPNGIIQVLSWQGSVIVANLLPVGGMHEKVCIVCGSTSELQLQPAIPASLIEIADHTAILGGGGASRRVPRVGIDHFSLDDNGVCTAVSLSNGALLCIQHDKQRKHIQTTSQLILTDQLYPTAYISNIKPVDAKNKRKYACLHTACHTSSKEGSLSILLFTLTNTVNNTINSSNNTTQNKLIIEYISIFKIKDNYIFDYYATLSLEPLFIHHSTCVLILHHDRLLTIYTTEPLIHKSSSLEIESSSIQSSTKIFTNIAFSRVIVVSSSITASSIHISSLITSLISSTQPHASGLLLDLADGCIISYSIRRPRSTLENLWHHTSLGLLNRSCEKITLPSKLLVDVAVQAVLRGATSNTELIQGGILVAQSHDIEGKHLVCSYLCLSKDTHAKNMCLWMLSRRSNKWRSTELMVTPSSKAYVLPLQSTAQTPTGVFYIYHDSTCTKWSTASIPMYIDQTLALAWFVDHTIIVLSIRKDLTYLELISKNKLHLLIQIPPILQNITIFDVYIHSSSIAYITISDGNIGIILQITAELCTYTNKGILLRYSPTIYKIQLIAYINYSLHTPYIPILNSKLFITKNNIIYLLCITKKGIVIVYNTLGEVSIIGENYENIYRFEYSLKYNTLPYGYCKSYSLDIGNKLWTPDCCIPITSFHKGTYFHFINGILVWSNKKDTCLQLHPNSNNIIHNCLPSQLINIKCISLSYYIFLYYLNNYTHMNLHILPTTVNMEEQLLLNLLTLTTANILATSVFVDSVEILIISIIQNKLFNKSNPIYNKLIHILFTYNPLLLIEIISLAIRKLEPSTHTRIFPLPTSSTNQHSSIDLYSYCISHTHITHASRFLTTACEQLGGSENLSSSVLSLAISTEFLHLALSGCSLVLAIECIEFCFRLEYLLAFEYQLKRDTDQQRSLLWGLTFSISKILLSPLTLFFEDVTSVPPIHPLPPSSDISSSNDDEGEGLTKDSAVKEEDETPLHAIFSLISKHVSASQFQLLLHNSLCTLYTVSLFCQSCFDTNELGVCAVTMSGMCTSKGATEGAYTRLYQLLTNPSSCVDLYQFLQCTSACTTTVNTCTTAVNTCTTTDTIVDSLAIIKQILTLFGLTELDCIHDRNTLENLLAAPLGETRLRQIVTAHGSNSNSSNGYIDRNDRSKFSHMDFGCFNIRKTSVQKLCQSLCYAALLNNKLCIAVFLSYLLNTEDVATCFYQLATIQQNNLSNNSHTNALSEVNIKRIIHFCFEYESVNTVFPKIDQTESNDSILFHINNELRTPRLDSAVSTRSGVPVSCLAAAEVVCQYFYAKKL